MAVACAAVSLVVGIFIAGGAAATSTVVVFPSNADTGVIDLDGNGAAEWNTYGPTNDGMAVGEQRCDGCNLKYVLPFHLDDAVRQAIGEGAPVHLHFRIWSVSNLGDRRLVLEALPGGLQGRADFDRPGLPFAMRVPDAPEGGVGVDVDVTTLLVGIDLESFSLRFSIEPAGTLNGVREFVNVATMESTHPENRPQLVVTMPDGQPRTVPPPTASPPPPTAAPPPVAPPPVSPPSGWRLSWADEFTGTSLDTSKWNYGASTFGDGNAEIACLQPGNVAVSDGTLKITARREQTVCPNESRPGEFPNGRPWTSGLIDTNDKFSQAQGRFEIRAKLPAGRGFWPAFWMTSQNYPFGGNGASGELDVFEAFGQSPTALLTSAHWYYPNGGECPNGRWGCSLMNKQSTVADMTSGFHTYAVEWEQDRIAWYFDGVEVFQLGSNAQYRWASAAPNPGAFSPPYPQPFTADNPMKLRVNLAVGGSEPGAPDASTPPTGTYEVDYVRVYTR